MGDDEKREAEITKRKKIGSLSLLDLHRVIGRWYCSLNCDNHKRGKGFTGDGEKDAPLLLHCGHLMCAGCMTNEAAKAVGGEKFQCAFIDLDADTGPIKCSSTRKYDEKELKSLPRVKHIAKNLSKFRGDGFSCPSCKQRVILAKQKARAANRRLPANTFDSPQFSDDRMLVCRKCMPSDNDDPFRRSPTPGYMYKNRICVICAKASIHEDHIKKLLNMNEAINVSEINPRDAETKNEDRLPWYLMSLPRSEMISFFEEIFLCFRCTEPFMKDRPHCILDCGHIVCAVCEPKIQMEDDGECGRGCKITHNSDAKGRISYDLQEVFKFDLFPLILCPGCTRFHHPDWAVINGNEDNLCAYCEFAA